jgi:hypothetical protein
VKLSRAHLTAAVRALQVHGDQATAAEALKLPYQTYRSRLKIAKLAGLKFSAPSRDLNQQQLQLAVDALSRHGSQTRAAEVLGLSRSGFQTRLSAARRAGVQPTRLEDRFQRKLPVKKTYVVTAAQNNTPVHPGLRASLEHLLRERRGELVVGPYRYRNPTSLWSSRQDADETWAPEIVDHMFGARHVLNDNLELAADVHLQATNGKPTSRFEALTKHRSGILCHPKLELVTVPAPLSKYPKIVTTTGAITVPNYSDTGLGKAGEFHHMLGACLVEVVDDKTFFVRQLNALPDGSFIDKDREYTPKGARKAGRAKAIALGDEHAGFHDPTVDEARFGEDGLIQLLRPEYLIRHDVLDFFSASHHHRNNPFVRVAKHRAGRDSVLAELKLTFDYLARRSPSFAQNVIVASNHHEHLERWLRELDWRDDPENAELYLELATALVKQSYVGKKGVTYPDPFKLLGSKMLPRGILERTQFLSRQDSFRLLGVEFAFHGDEGADGARGSPQAFKRIGRKTVTGHSHRPGISEGNMSLGMGALRARDYERGLSSHLHADAVLYQNGKRCLYFYIHGRYCL